MNKILLYLLIAVCLSSCRSEIEPLFSMPLEVDFTIPAGLSGVLTHTFIIQDVANPLDTYLKSTNVDTSEIRTIQGGKGEITSVFSETNYEFVNRVSVWMVDPDDPRIRKEIHYLDFNQNNNNNARLRLLTSISNVEDLLKKKTFDMEIKLEFRSFSPQEIKNRFIFDLEAFQ
ncbi:hypothetical protein [Portibacter marinus]|uniref:hypothetical protein n=1 Tax=Portibacter marinus TaxID=2898660 RepID=UPI001F3A48DD|nr:hypothetical protein [Portibacter marinus]